MKKRKTQSRERTKPKDNKPLLSLPLHKALERQDLLDAIDFRGRLIPVLGRIGCLRPHQDILDLLYADIDATDVELELEEQEDLSGDSFFWRWLMAAAKPFRGGGPSTNQNIASRGVISDHEAALLEAQFFVDRGRIEGADDSPPRWGRLSSPVPWRWHDLIASNDPLEIDLTAPLLEELLRRAGFEVDPLDIEGRIDDCRKKAEEWATSVSEPNRPIRRKMPAESGTTKPSPFDLEEAKRWYCTGEPARYSLLDILLISIGYKTMHSDATYLGVDPFLLVSAVGDELAPRFRNSGLTAGAAQLFQAAQLLCETSHD
jgi:hypothetical protein